MKYIVKVEKSGDFSSLTENEREMDMRAREAVKAAIKKAKVCKKPIARYDAKARRAYLEYPDGEKVYVSK